MTEEARLLGLLEHEPFHLEWPFANQAVQTLIDTGKAIAARDYEANVGKGRRAKVVVVERVVQ